jgi:hypothetical protein
MSSVVNLGDLRRLTPVSDCWGYDRGQPIDRVYIEEFVGSQADLIKGVVLEVAEPLYTHQFGGDSVRKGEVLALEAGPGVTYVADLATEGALPCGRFDCAIVTQTMQLIYDAQAAVRSLHAALRPGAALIATVPGITRMSETDVSKPWYWAFSTEAAGRLFGDVFGRANTVVQSYGNVLAATAFLYGLAASELTEDELSHRDPSFPVIIGIRAVKA